MIEKNLMEKDVLLIEKLTRGHIARNPEIDKAIKRLEKFGFVYINGKDEVFEYCVNTSDNKKLKDQYLFRAEQRKREKVLARLRDKYRNNVCTGCSNNRYNYKSQGERPGIDAPTIGEGCWFLMWINRKGCPDHTDLRQAKEAQEYQKKLKERYRH